MALKPHRALPGPTDEPSEPTREHSRPSPPASTPLHVAAAALAARAALAAPGRDAAGPTARPSTMCPAPASGRFHRTPARDPLARAPRPGPPAPRSFHDSVAARRGVGRVTPREHGGALQSIVLAGRLRVRAAHTSREIRPNALDSEVLVSKRRGKVETRWPITARRKCTTELLPAPQAFAV